MKITLSAKVSMTYDIDPSKIENTKEHFLDTVVGRILDGDVIITS